MKLHRPVVSALVLFAACPLLAPLADAGKAEAGDRVRHLKVWDKVLKAEDEDVIVEGLIGRRLRVSVEDDATTASITLAVESDAGDEDLSLVESDAWLHGAASIAALPAAGAGLEVTLYDSASAALISFSGTLGRDGSVTLTADRSAQDVELLAAEVFPAGKGYELGVDLAGADTYAVAYASVTLTEGAPVCVATDEKGNCLKWDTSKQVTTRSELDWDSVGSIWEAEPTLAHEGLVKVKVKAYDAEGTKVETLSTELGAPWLDGGEGVNSLATDEDPLTRVALRWPPVVDAFEGGWSSRQLVVLSEGWTAGDDVPVDAQVALVEGGTFTIPVNSYQKKGDLFKIGDEVEATVLSIDRDEGKRRRLRVTDTTGFAVEFDALTDLEVGTPVCSEGYCVVLSEQEDGDLGLVLSAYGADAAALPDDVELLLTTVDASGEVTEEEGTLTFDDELTAVFSNEVDLVGDPVGLGLSGKVSLLGAPNRKGKQETLAKGTFYAELTRDTDGDLELAGSEKGVVSNGSVVQLGEPVGLVGPDGDPEAPPVVVYAVSGNGSGTKAASSQASIKPQLL